MAHTRPPDLIQLPARVRLRVTDDGTLLPDHFTAVWRAEDGAAIRVDARIRDDGLCDANIKATFPTAGPVEPMPPDKLKVPLRGASPGELGPLLVDRPALLQAALEAAQLRPDPGVVFEVAPAAGGERSPGVTSVPAGDAPELAAAVALYKEAEEAGGRQRTAHVAESLGVSRSTAARLIRRARDHGLLPEAVTG